MKTLPLFLLLLTPSAWALKLSCVTAVPTTSVYGETQGAEFIVRVIHHNGWKYMPLHTGTITPADLPLIQKKSDVFSKLGDSYEFRWDLSKCQRQDQEIFGCFSGTETSINGVKVKPYSIATKRTTTEILGSTLEGMEVSMLLSVEGESQMLTMKYDREECFQD